MCIHCVLFHLLKISIKRCSNTGAVATNAHQHLNLKALCWAPCGTVLVSAHSYVLCYLKGSNDHFLTACFYFWHIYFTLRFRSSVFLCKKELQFQSFWTPGALLLAQDISMSHARTGRSCHTVYCRIYWGSSGAKQSNRVCSYSQMNLFTNYRSAVFDILNSSSQPSLKTFCNMLTPPLFLFFFFFFLIYFLFSGFHLCFMHKIKQNAHKNMRVEVWYRKSSITKNCVFGLIKN